jgi:RNA polymerase sigma-70 factor, ECF subfamily
MAGFGGPGGLDYAALSPEDLVRACLHSGEEPAWIEFVRRFQPLIASVVLRVARQWGESSPQAIDDLVQETYLKLCADRLRVLQSFQSVHKDAIFGFIKVFVANLTHDHFKSRRSLKRGGPNPLVSIDGEDRECGLPGTPSAPATVERDILLQQIDACLQAVACGPDLERDRKIFWLYYRVGLAASAIAALPSVGLSTKGVESTLLRLTRQVRERLANSEWERRRKERSTEGIRSQESF